MQSRIELGRVGPEPRLESVTRYRGTDIELVYSVEGHCASVIVLRGGSISFPHPMSNWGESLGTEELDDAVREAARLDITRAKLASLLGNGS